MLSVNVFIYMCVCVRVRARVFVCAHVRVYVPDLQSELQVALDIHN